MINIAFDEEMMREAIAEGKKAAALGEAPIGAVIVQNGVVLSRGHNLRETGRNALAHAEIVAIDAACRPAGRLAPSGLHPLCDAGTLPDVRRCNHQFPH